MPPEDAQDVPRARAAPILAVVVAAALVALLGYGVLARGPNTTIRDALSRGEAPAAPGFDLEVLSAGEGAEFSPAWRAAAADGRVSLTELRGAPVVVNIWASWCEPCRVEAPLLERGWRSARERGVLYVGVNMQDIRSDAREFIAQYRLRFPSLRDPSDDTSRRWGGTGIPETYFIDRGGRVVGHVTGNVTARALRAGVNAALKGVPILLDSSGGQRPPR